MKRLYQVSGKIWALNWCSDSSMLLLAVFSGLFAIYINLVSDASDGSLMGSSLLYWLAIGSMVWSKRTALYLKSGFWGTVTGTTILLLVLLKSAFMHGYDPFLRVTPFLSGLGLGLLASGFSGLKQYWKELVILAFLIPPPSALATIIDISSITARFSTVLLWYSGFDVVRQGSFILIPNGGIEVYSGCSGIDIMLHMLGLSAVFLAIFPTSRMQKFLLPIVALLIAFVVNAIRVGIMAILSEPINKVAFEYWHKGNGSLVFSLIAVALLGAYCFWAVGQGDEDNNVDPDLMEQE